MRSIDLDGLPFCCAFAGLGISAVFLLTEAGLLPEMNEPFNVLALASGGVGGFVVGCAVRPPLRRVAERIVVRTSSLRLALFAIVTTTFGVTIALSYLWIELPAIAFALVALYFMGGFIGIQPRKWLLGEAIASGVLFGFTLSAIVAACYYLYW